MAYRRCQHPGCTRMAIDPHHIIFRSEWNVPEINEPWNIVYLCREHHTLGKDSPHQSQTWRYYYYKFLPHDYAMRLRRAKGGSKTIINRNKLLTPKGD